MSESFNPILNKKEINNHPYYEENFTLENAKQKVETFISDFKDYYSSLGYKEESPVLVSSGADSTVRFVGSHISVLKPYLIEDKIPKGGVFMSQNCLRTRNADKLLDDDYLSNFGSYFISIGVLNSPDQLNQTCVDSFNFLHKKLKIPSQDILVRANSNDLDLLNACKSCFDEKNIELDTQNSEYYKHKIGVDNINGRSFNVALKNIKDGVFVDVGNVIIFEDNVKKKGIEVAFGVTNILKQMYGLNHVQDCMPVPGLVSNNEGIKRKFEDAIITSVVLFREGLRPLGNDNKNRILKKYVRSLSYFRAKSNIDINTLPKIISNFENREFSNSEENVSILIKEFVAYFENELLTKKELSEEDKKIKEALKLLI